MNHFAFDGQLFKSVLQLSPGSPDFSISDLLIFDSMVLPPAQ
jgi:hypothetical protein